MSDENHLPTLAPRPMIAFPAVTDSFTGCVMAILSSSPANSDLTLPMLTLVPLLFFVSWLSAFDLSVMITESVRVKKVLEHYNCYFCFAYKVSLCI